MIKPVINSKKYFQASYNHFWKWTENTKVIEWTSGSTICYRDDLIGLLKEISADGFPPLDPILLILSACREKIGNHGKLLIMRSLGPQVKDEAGKTLDEYVFSFLDKISSLPPELRTGSIRIHLLYEVFQRQGFVFSNMQLRQALDELNSGRLDSLISEAGEAVTKEYFASGLDWLADASKRFPTTESLAIKLRTGLKSLPAPIEIKLPDLSQGDLFDRLSQDEKTIGISRLAKRLVSVLNIPMHSQGSGDQSYGGISDITNRGNYDKLLLSELAHDDILLTARLVNNEALYFRREEPPENPKRQRTILLDTTIKMWGVPRVFGLSAALAFAHNSKHGELIESYVLGGETYTPVDLSEPEGIIKALESLHHSLHCGKALQSAINELPALAQNEYILVTEARMFNSPEFHASLVTTRELLSFIITVSRNGELQLLECIKGRTRVLSTARLDLEELLFAGADNPSKNKKKQYDTDLKFLLEKPSPLLFPRNNIKNIPGRLFVIEGGILLAIIQTQRLLAVKSREKGAYEVLDFIEKGIYTFGSTSANDLYVLVHKPGKKFLKIYTISPSQTLVNAYNLSEEIQFPTEAAYANNKFYIKTAFASFLYDCAKSEVVDKKAHNGYDNEISEAKKNENTISPVLHYHLDNPSNYSAMYRIREMYVSEEKKLVIGNYTLELVSNNQDIRIQENKVKPKGIKYSREVNTQIKLLPNDKIKFSMRVWKDGSQVIADARGFLHLKSADKNLPEISFPFITGMATACWASDGVFCGSPFFKGENVLTSVSVEEFYSRYIQPFIDRLL